MSHFGFTDRRFLGPIFTCSKHRHKHVLHVNACDHNNTNVVENMEYIVTRNIYHLLFISAQTQSLKQLNSTTIIAQVIDKMSLYIG